MLKVSWQSSAYLDYSTNIILFINLVGHGNHVVSSLLIRWRHIFSCFDSRWISNNRIGWRGLWDSI